MLYKTPTSGKRTKGVKNYSHGYGYKNRHQMWRVLPPSYLPGEEGWDIPAAERWK